MTKTKAVVIAALLALASGCAEERGFSLHDDSYSTTRDVLNLGQKRG